MARTKPYSGRSLDRLVSLINLNNGLNLNYNTDFTLTNLTSVVGTNGRNTQLTFTPRQFQFYNNQNIQYKRLSLAVLNTLPAEEIQKVVIQRVPFFTHEVLPEINEALGLNLDPSEVLNELHTSIVDSYRIKIRDNSASFAWLESEFYFQAQHQNVRLMEDGSVRLMEDGSPRLMESLLG